MRNKRTIIKFEGDLKTTMAQLIREFLLIQGAGDKKVLWTDSHELTVIHKEGRKKEGEK